MYQHFPGYGPVARCPVKILTAETKQIMEIYTKCRSWTEGGPQSNGILPIAGGVLDQAHTGLAAFDVLDRAVVESAKRVRAKKGFK